MQRCQPIGSLAEQLQQAYLCGQQQFAQQVLTPLSEQVQRQKQQTAAHPPQTARLLEALRPFAGSAAGQIVCLLVGVLLADAACRLMGRQASVVLQSRGEAAPQQASLQALTMYLLFQSRKNQVREGTGPC